MNQLRNKKGFTLIEVIVVAAIIAILAGILVPMIMNQIEDSKKTRALGDCKAILGAATSFTGSQAAGSGGGVSGKVGRLPLWNSGETDPTKCTDNDIIKFMYTSDNQNAIVDPNPNWLAARTAAGGNDSRFSSVMNQVPANHVCYKNSNAISVFPSDAAVDPWGNSYISNTGGFADPTKPPVWIISAGPDGVLQTNPTDTVLAGDDIGVRWQ